MCYLFINVIDANIQDKEVYDALPYFVSITATLVRMYPLKHSLFPSEAH